MHWTSGAGKGCETIVPQGLCVLTIKLYHIEPQPTEEFIPCLILSPLHLWLESELPSLQTVGKRIVIVLCGLTSGSLLFPLHSDWGNNLLH